MQHDLKVIARNFRFDEKEFVEFALNNKRKYGIVEDVGIITTSTWFSDDLINGFRIKKSQKK